MDQHACLTTFDFCTFKIPEDLEMKGKVKITDDPLIGLASWPKLVLESQKMKIIEILRKKSVVPLIGSASWLASRAD